MRCFGRAGHALNVKNVRESYLPARKCCLYACKIRSASKLVLLVFVYPKIASGELHIYEVAYAVAAAILRDARTLLVTDQMSRQLSTEYVLNVAQKETF